MDGWLDGWMDRVRCCGWEGPPTWAGDGPPRFHHRCKKDSKSRWNWDQVLSRLPEDQPEAPLLAGSPPHPPLLLLLLVLLPSQETWTKIHAASPVSCPFLLWICRIISSPVIHFKVNSNSIQFNSIHSGGLLFCDEIIEIIEMTSSAHAMGRPLRVGVSFSFLNCWNSFNYFCCVTKRR